MKSTKIIGVSGLPGAGKDEIGQIIRYLTSNYYPHTSYSKFLNSRLDDDYEYNLGEWNIKKFADKVTKCYYEITGVNYHQLPREIKEKHRESYVNFAEATKSVFGKDVWVNALFSKEQYINWVITDVRFNEEINKIKSLGGIIIRVERDEAIKSSLISENSLNDYKDWDYVIENNDDIESLIDKVKEILIKEGIL